MGLISPTINTSLSSTTTAAKIVADDLEVDSGTLSIDAANNRIGVGTITPGVQLEVQDITTSSANTGGALRLSANDGAAMGDSHRLGVIEFTGAEDGSNTQVVGARIEAITDAAWTNAENGTALYFYTTDGNASQTNVLKIDSNTKATFAGDVAIGDGKLVLNTTAVTSTAAELNLLDGVSGLVQADLTKLAAIDASAAEINAAADASARTAAAVDVTADHFLFADGGATGATKVESLADYATAIAGTGLSASSGALNVDASQTGITSVGTIGTGTWQGTAIASAYLDADTCHLSGAQTFTGTKTLNSFKGTGGTTVTNILDEDAMGSDSATALATQQSIKAYADTKSPVAGSSSIVTTGTIGTGTWQGTVIAEAYLPNAGAAVEGVVELATIAETNTGTDAARVVTPDGLNDWTGGAGAITKLGTIATGVWQGTAIAQAYIAGDAINGDKIADDAIDSEHYTDGSIDTDHIADDQVTLAKMAGIARGKIIYGDASGNPAVLALGADTYVLTSDGSDAVWASAAATPADDSNLILHVQVFS